MKPYRLALCYDVSGGETPTKYTVVLNNKWVLGAFFSFEFARSFLTTLLNDEALLKKTVEGVAE